MTFTRGLDYTFEEYKVLKQASDIKITAMLRAMEEQKNKGFYGLICAALIDFKSEVEDASHFTDMFLELKKKEAEKDLSDGTPAPMSDEGPITKALNDFEKVLNDNLGDTKVSVTGFTTEPKKRGPKLKDKKALKPSELRNNSPNKFEGKDPAEPPTLLTYKGKGSKPRKRCGSCALYRNKKCLSSSYDVTPMHTCSLWEKKQEEEE